MTTITVMTTASTTMTSTKRTTRAIHFWQTTVTTMTTTTTTTTTTTKTTTTTTVGSSDCVFFLASEILDFSDPHGVECKYGGSHRQLDRVFLIRRVWACPFFHAFSFLLCFLATIRLSLPFFLPSSSLPFFLPSTRLPPPFFLPFLFASSLPPFIRPVPTLPSPLKFPLLLPLSLFPPFCFAPFLLLFPAPSRSSFLVARFVTASNYPQFGK